MTRPGEHLGRMGKGALVAPSGLQRTLSARVEGHSDSAGRDEANLALSQSRADAVKGGLVARGVGAQRIQAVGYGEARPIADNGTRAGRDRNRRIEVYLIGDVD